MPIISTAEHRRILQEAERAKTLEQQLEEANSTLTSERNLHESLTVQHDRLNTNYQALQDAHQKTQADNRTQTAWLDGLLNGYEILGIPRPDTTQYPNQKSFLELSTLVKAAVPYARLTSQERQVVDNALSVLRQPSQHRVFDGNNITDYVNGLIQNTNYQDPNSVLTSVQLVLTDLDNVILGSQSQAVAWNLLKTLSANPQTKTILEKADAVRLDTIAQNAISVAINYIPDIFARIFDNDVSPFISKNYREGIARNTILTLPSDKYTDLPLMLAKYSGSIDSATLENTLREKLAQILYHEKAETFNTWYQNSTVIANIGATSPQAIFADAINDIQRALKNPDERISAYERVRDTAQTLKLPIAPDAQQTLARRYLSDILSVGDTRKFEDARASQFIVESIGEQGTLLAVKDYLTGQKYIRDAGQAEFYLRLLIEYKEGLEANLGANNYNDAFSEKVKILQNSFSQDQRLAVYERIGKLAYKTPQAQAQTKILARGYLDQVLLSADKGRFDSAITEQFVTASLEEQGIASAIKDHVANQELKHTEASTQFSIGLLQQFEAELRLQLGEETYTIAFARHISNQGIESLLGLKESPIYGTNQSVQSEINSRINERVAEQFPKEKDRDNALKNPKAVAALVEDAERLPVEARKILLGGVLEYISNMEIRTHYTEKIAHHLEATDLMQTYDNAIARTFRRELKDTLKIDLGNTIRLLRERISQTGEDNVPELLNALLTKTQLSSPPRVLDLLSVLTQSDYTKKYVTDQTKASVFGAYIDHIETTQEPRDPRSDANKTRIDSFVEKYTSQMPADTVGRVLLHNLAPRRDDDKDAKYLSGFSRVLLERTILSESDLGNVVANVVRQILYDEETGRIRPISFGTVYEGSSYVGLLAEYAKHIPTQELSELVNMSITSAASATGRYKTETGYGTLRIYDEAGLSLHISSEIRQNVYRGEFEERTKDLPIRTRTDRDKDTFEYGAKKVVDFVTAEASHLPVSYFEEAIEKFYKSDSLEHVRKIYDTAPDETHPQLGVKINNLYQTHRGKFSTNNYVWEQDVKNYLTGIIKPN